MQHPSTTRRTAFAALAAGSSLVLLAACGGTTQPAAGGTDSGGTASKTIAFSPLALKIPAMKSLSEGVLGYGKSKGYTVLVQDPNLDPQKQVTDLTSVIQSGRAGGAWVIAVAPSSLKALVAAAQKKKVPLILNGSPADYGVAGPGPGISFSTIDYAAQGKAIGEALGECVNAKLGGKAEVILGTDAAGIAGKADLEKAAKEALTATAPGAKVVTTLVTDDRSKSQTDIGSALQGHPDANALYTFNDEGALGAIGAFKAAGKKLPCLAEAGGNDEVLAAVKSGEIYASVALQFADDMTQSFDTLTKMMKDPSAAGVQLTVPQKVIKADG